MMIMKSSTRRFLVPFALGATGLWMLLLAGCGEGGSSTGGVSSSVSPVEDAALMGKLEKLRGERTELVAMRQKIVAKMTAMVDAKRAAMKGASDEAVKAALEKDPEWRSLYARCEDLNTAIGEKRAAAAGELRAKLASGQKISK